MTLLYNVGRYENVFEVHQTFDRNLSQKSYRELQPFNDSTTLAMAALYQHGTDEAFRDAMELKREKIDKYIKTEKDTIKVSFSRVKALAGLFAVEKGKYGLAVDFLDTSGPKSDLILNILCYAKAKSGDADGAIKDLSKTVQSGRK